MQHLSKILALTYGLCCFFSSLSYSSESDIPLLGKTITQAKQQQMSPKQALHRLKDGNQRF